MRLLLSVLVLWALWSGAAAADDTWTKFHSETDGFSVEFPGVPSMLEALPLVVSNVTIKTRTYGFVADKQTYLVNVSDLSNRLLVSNPKVFLDSLVKEQSAGGEIDTNAPIEIDGSPGREVTFATGDGELVRAREIYVSGTIVQVIFRDKAKDHRAAKADAARFMKSFHFGASSGKDTKQTARSTPE